MCLTFQSENCALESVTQLVKLLNFNTRKTLIN